MQLSDGGLGNPVSALFVLGSRIGMEPGGGVTGGGVSSYLVNNPGPAQSLAFMIFLSPRP